MKGEREFEFLGESTTDNNNNSSNNEYYYPNQGNSKGVSSTSGFCFPDVGSSSIPSFDHTPKPHFVDQFSGLADSWYATGGNNGFLSDELGLSREFQRMNIGNGNGNGNTRTEFNSSDVGRLGRETEGFRISDYNNVPKIRPSNGQNFGFSEGPVNGFSGNGGFVAPLFKDERNAKDEISFRLGQRGDNLGNRNCSIDFPFDQKSLRRADSYGNAVPITGNGGLIEREGRYSHLVPIQFQSLYGSQIVGDPIQQCVMEGCKDVSNPWACSQNVSMYRSPYLSDGMLPHCGVHYCGNMDSPQLVHYRQALNRGNKLYNSMREKMRMAEEREDTQSFASMKNNRRQLDSNGCESGAIPKSFQSNGRVKTSFSGTTMQKLGERSLEVNGQVMSCDPVILQALYDSMSEVPGNIYHMAKDQHGCRFLQKKFDKGSFDDVQLIFNEIIDHIVELMINPFGNYLIQKLLDVCNEEQRMRIVHAVTRDRGELVRICLNTHGTRVVQKLIESLKTKKQISLIIRALEPGFLDLIKDLNGNHVVQRCLQCLSSEDNKFIFDAAAKFCVEIATHRHGCCVLQRCIAHSSGEHQKKLVEGICANGLHLAQDPFGNYVVQYIIELKIAAASAQLTSQFEGHYIQLATQKFSSHVVEKCLKFIEDARARIVYELLSVSHFEQLLQDPFANYVIQSALEVTKGPVNESLVAALRPHSMLRTNPYCKKIFTRGMLKK